MKEGPGRPVRQVNRYLKYSGMAIQLFVLMVVAALIGQWIDKKLNSPKPYFTVLLILFFTGGYLYRLVKELNRNDEP